MKLKGYQCDRCFAHYEKNETMYYNKRVIGIATTHPDSTIRRFDLCDDCLNDILTLLENPDAMVSIEEEEEEERELLLRAREDFTMTVREED